MSINGVFGNLTNTPTSSTSNVNAVTPSGAGASSIPPAVGGPATASISTAGQFFSQLQELSQTDPSEFKTVAGQLATSFQNAASQASGSQAKFLGNLANQLSQAAQTGSLQPPTAQAGQAGQGQAGGAHHHHHHGGGGGGGGGSGQSDQVQAAFQNAMNILGQALQGGTSAGASTPSIAPSASST